MRSHWDRGQSGIVGWRLGHQGYLRSSPVWDRDHTSPYRPAGDATSSHLSRLFRIRASVAKRRDYVNFSPQPPVTARSDRNAIPQEPKAKSRQPVATCYTEALVGAWRSPVAHRYGVPVVGGSNPLAPTLSPRQARATRGRFVCYPLSSRWTRHRAIAVVARLPR